jgi:FYVE zinc finger/Zinc finger, C3HC4 type (RING finger)
VHHNAITGSLGQYEIRPRILLAATVYHNTASDLWITTINTNQRGISKNPILANKFLKAFSFPTEREARESAIANAPPKMVSKVDVPYCFCCKGNFAVFRRAGHCRNCGVCICNNCSVHWQRSWLPDTYNLKHENTLRICISCNALAASFKKALLEGDLEEAIAIYGTGNVNLRTPFPFTNKKDELMYPVHCAVEGGNLGIVQWLIDDHFCPIKIFTTGSNPVVKRSSRRTESLILTSKGRSVLTIALDSTNVDMLRYLVVDCGLALQDVRDVKTTVRALEAALYAMPAVLGQLPSTRPTTPHCTRWDHASFDEFSEPSSLGADEHLFGDVESTGMMSTKSARTSSSRNNGGGTDSCIICCDRKIDCVATPCGHQVCCLTCSANLTSCPVCNDRTSFIKIFRP